MGIFAGGYEQVTLCRLGSYILYLHYEKHDFTASYRPAWNRYFGEGTGLVDSQPDSPGKHLPLLHKTSPFQLVAIMAKKV